MGWRERERKKREKLKKAAMKEGEEGTKKGDGGKDGWNA